MPEYKGGRNTKATRIVITTPCRFNLVDRLAEHMNEQRLTKNDDEAKNARTKRAGKVMDSEAPEIKGNNKKEQARSQRLFGTIKMRRSHVMPVLPLLYLALLVAMPGSAFGQGVSSGIPAHASAKRYGDGWECDQGYREADGACLAVVVPANAFATNSAYGPGWECSWGYRERGALCVAIKVPLNAHISSSRTASWACNRGYRAEKERCVAVAVPANGYLTDATYGPSWACARGFRANEGACIPIKVPANGYLTGASHGPGWACDRGFRANENACIRIRLPENSYLTDVSYGPGWRCDRGYRAARDACVAIDIPENAHLDRSGNRWDCNKPFRKRDGKCALR